MRPSGAITISRSSSQSSNSESDSESAIAYYTRSDQPCMISFKPGDVVWARWNGVWALGVVVSDSNALQNENGLQPIPTVAVLTRAGSTCAAPILVALSPLFGSLKPADTYTTALLRAEGIFPLAGTDHTEILDLRVKAHAFIDRRCLESKKIRRRIR